MYFKLAEAKTNMNKLHLNGNGNLLTINGQTQRLDPLMMRLFEYFINHQKQIISRKCLSENVWQRDCVSDEAINRGVSRLRKLLGGGRNSYIITIPKQGYSFTLPKNTYLNVNKQSTIPQVKIHFSTNQYLRTHQLASLIKDKWYKWCESLNSKGITG